MTNKKDIINRDISKGQFDFVQKGEKLYDQKFEGKPIGYLQDVWIRFRKNKTNLTASIILLILIICALTMPTLSGKDYTNLDEKLAYLPPRVPVLEKLGIMDGVTDLEDMPVDLDQYNEKTGLYLPEGFTVKAIDMSTLTNKTIMSSEKSPIVLHGQMSLKLDTESSTYTVESLQPFSLTKSNNSVITVDVFELNEGSQIEVSLQTGFGPDFEVVKTITEPGQHEIKIYADNEEEFADIFSKLQLKYTSDTVGSYAAITSITLTDDSSTEPVRVDEGYVLASYDPVAGKGSVLRQNGELIVASFKYDKYVAAFDLTKEIAFSSKEYDELIEEYGDRAVIIPNPNNPDGWFFEKGFPIREVIKKNDSIVIDDVSYSSYEVMLDYKEYLGYEELPYFLFGTTAAGRDLFSLVWVGLRTSLYIGVVVTAINVTIGVLYGSISGFYGGLVDLLMQRFAEVLGRTPWLVVLSIMVVLFDPGIKTLILTLVISGWIGTAGITRMQFYRYKGREYVLASRTMGAKDARLIFKHILPNGIGTIITASVLSIPGVIFTEAALSFLGYGVGHGQSFNIFGYEFSGVSIGVLLADGRNSLVRYPHLTVYPAVVVSILMITFNMFGNALRDAFNPSLRGVE